MSDTEAAITESLPLSSREEFLRDHGKASRVIVMVLAAPPLLVGIIAGLIAGLVLALPGLVIGMVAAIPHWLRRGS